MTAPVAMDDALPLLSTNPLVGRNNARDIRRFLFEGLLLTPQGGFTRRGVFHRGWVDPVTLEPLELKVLESAVPGQSVRVNTGLFTVHRGAIGAATNEGPYVGGSPDQSTITLNMPAAPTLNHRYDVVYSKVMDKNITADTAGSEHGPYIDVRSGVAGAVLNVNGTPGTAGAPPTTPDGFLPLAFITRMQNDNVISQAEILDCRRGTALPGVPRVLFPWDETNIATDVGYRAGEERYRRAIAPYPAMVDRWDGLVWRGTRPAIAFTQPAQTAIGTMPSGATASLASGKVTIPWPGWPYKIAGYACVLWATPTVGELIGEINLDSDLYTAPSGGGNVPPASALGWNSSTLPAGGQNELVIQARPGVTVSDGLTHVVSCWLKANPANAGNGSIFAGYSYRFVVEIIPA